MRQQEGRNQAAKKEKRATEETSRLPGLRGPVNQGNPQAGRGRMCLSAICCSSPGPTRFHHIPRGLHRRPGIPGASCPGWGPSLDGAPISCPSAAAPAPPRWSERSLLQQGTPTAPEAGGGGRAAEAATGDSNASEIVCAAGSQA